MALVSTKVQEKLKTFLAENKKCDLLTAYMFFLEQKHKIKPMLFPQSKLIYQSADRAVELLEREGKLWRETEIRIALSTESVNDRTKKVFICPFCGKVVGDNTCPNPEDEIYAHVSSCPENKERSGGLRVKRFFMSEDPEVIKSYIKERKAPITKTVFSSVVTGKLFNSRDGVVDDFRKNHLKPMTLVEVQKQNRFEMEGSFLEFLQGELDEDKIEAFVGELAEHEEFMPHVGQWVEIEED
jgi:Protein of unknown function (DUF2709)